MDFEKYSRHVRGDAVLNKVLAPRFFFDIGLTGYSRVM